MGEPMDRPGDKAPFPLSDPTDSQCWLHKVWKVQSAHSAGYESSHFHNH